MLVRANTVALLAIVSVMLVVGAVHHMGSASAQQAPDGTRSVVELIQVAEDVYSFRYANHITMFIVTDAGVITADPLGQQNPEAPTILKAAIRSVTDQPVRYVLITHWGADHGMGGAVFADTARFISHPITAQRIAQVNDPTTPVPDILVTDRLRLELGGKQVDVYYPGVTQGDDYLLLHYPARGIVLTVDFVRSRAVAFRDFPNGNVMDWVQSLTWIENNLVFDTVLLGHPPPLVSRAAVGEMRQYLIDLMDAIRAARAQGQADNSEEMVATVRAILAPRYATWANFDAFLALNVAGATRTMSDK
jgi:cyclase